MTSLVFEKVDVLQEKYVCMAVRSSSEMFKVGCFGRDEEEEG